VLMSIRCFESNGWTNGVVVPPLVGPMDPLMKSAVSLDRTRFFLLLLSCNVVFHESIIKRLSIGEKIFHFCDCHVKWIPEYLCISSHAARIPADLQAS